MYAYGCTPSVYRVTDQYDQRLYEDILRSGGILGEHSRQDTRSLGMVRQLKPSFDGASWLWFQDERLNQRSREEGGPGGVLLGFPGSGFRKEYEGQ